MSALAAAGAPAQSEKIATYLRAKSEASGTPILAFADDVAASGGYWLLCAGDELYACRTSLVGSIGVVSPNFGFVEAMRRAGVERRTLQAGEGLGIEWEGWGNGWAVEDGVCTAPDQRSSQARARSAWTPFRR